MKIRLSTTSQSPSHSIRALSPWHTKTQSFKNRINQFQPSPIKMSPKPDIPISHNPFISTFQEREDLSVIVSCKILLF